MHPVVERAWKLVPKPMQDAIASGVDRARGVTPPPAPVPDTSKRYRMLVGPVNYAGQGYRWSRAVEESGEVSARNFVHVDNNPLQYKADYLVTWRTAEHSRAWQKDMIDTIARDYTHVLIEACYPVLGGMFKGDMRKQVALMRDAGVKVGIVGHGTDVRLPSTHMKNDEWSYFHNDVWVPADLLEPVVAANLQLIADLDVPTFVSTAGLLIDVPDAHFLGVVVDPDKWANEEPLLVRDRIKVVHAPTNPNLKGTLHIEPIARKLHEEGLIEYVEIKGVPNDEMPRVFADADVVLDQFRTNDYGVGACETMASGRVVLAHVSPEVRAEVERNAGMPLPIPETTLDTLEEVLRDIAGRRDHYRALAATGPEFVRRLHSGDFSRDVLMRHFLAV
ncbi:glycosyltransferase [Agromyces sp. Marseille-P2726]|uniref:glycosyltransferase n=1 Tax=Agromyces sp. Marseille-P2726 TaxID=2709132 RepID=UPI00156D611F|nr:glycosyltransferase [Agromyces sp. Marseille-P2726]